MELVYNGHCLGQSLLAVIERWPDNTCIFQYNYTVGTTIAGWFIQVDLNIQVCDVAGLYRFHCTILISK